MLKKRLVILGLKGGTGKSTITWSLYQKLLNSKIIDLDNQKTLTNVAELTGKSLESEGESEYLLYDCPPYRDSTLEGVISHADVILIPVCIGVPDLLATKGIVEDIRRLKIQHKAWIIFNRVRKPINSSYKKIKAWFSANYKDIKRAKTELSELRSFRDVFFSPLEGKAAEQIDALVNEIEVY